MDLINEIIELLQELDIEVSSGDDILLPPDLNGAIIDSLDVVDIISEIEDRYDIEIDGTDVVPENFVDVKTLAELVRRYIEVA